MIGLPDPKWGETVCAVVQLQPGQTLTIEDLVAFARTRLAGFKCPRNVFFVGDLPRQNTGKTDKSALRRTYGTP